MRSLDTLLICVALIAPAGLFAQQQPELDVAVTYSAQQGTVIGGGNFWAQGGSAEVAATFYHGLGVAMNVAGTRASNISPSGVALTTVTSTFGPRYTWSHPLHEGSVKGFSLFGQTLIGVAQGLDSVFPSPTGAQSDVEDFALQIGGGADFLLSRHFARACAAGGLGSHAVSQWRLQRAEQSQTRRGHRIPPAKVRQEHTGGARVVSGLCRRGPAAV